MPEDLCLKWKLDHIDWVIENMFPASVSGEHCYAATLDRRGILWMIVTLNGCIVFLPRKKIRLKKIVKWTKHIITTKMVEILSTNIGSPFEEYETNLLPDFAEDAIQLRFNEEK